MNNRKGKTYSEPIIVISLVIMCLFAAATYFIERRLAAVELGVTLALMIYSQVRVRKNRKEMQAFVESITYNTESATNNTLIHFPLPMAVFRLNDSGIVWANQPFWTMCGRTGPAFDTKLSNLVPEFSGKWLLGGKNRAAELLEVNGKKYQVNGNMIRAGDSDESYEFMGITYWVDMTDYDHIHREYMDSRPVVMMILVDNYEEMMRPLNDRQRTVLRGSLDLAIEKWCDGRYGIMRRIDRDRYMFIFEKRYLDKIVAGRFDLVEQMHEIVSPTGIHATVSLGVGEDGSGYEENYSFASLAADMALSRGGDQAVIKNKYNFEFFGGRGGEVETRTKVKSRVMANSLSQLIVNAEKVFIMGHRFADLDAVGSAAGVACIARKLGKPARIVIDREHTAARPLLELLSSDEAYENAFLAPRDALLQANEKTLLVVVDTHRPEQVEDEDMLTACAGRLALIDHHRRAATYIENAALTLYEPNASSASELVTELLQELVEPRDIRNVEANAMLSGIVLDTKNFTIRTGDRTFDAAAYLRRAGADPVRVKQLFQNDMEETMERYDILKEAKLYKGVAVAATQETHNRIIAAQAADELLNISGVSASAVVCAMEGGGVAISARSIGHLNAQVLMEQLGGGGNKSAAGVQLKDMTLQEAVDKLYAAIDEYEATE